jgi:hypothetical protein
MSTIQTCILIFLILVGILAILARYKFSVLDYFKNLFRQEGFQNPWIPETTPEGVADSDLAPAMAVQTEKLLTSDRLIPLTEDQAVANWSRMTSEKCFRSDMGEQLKPVGNYLQRTNNYVRSHPDSCSAPNHEFVGTFYQPHEGIGATPASGLPFPPSTQCA